MTVKAGAARLMCMAGTLVAVSAGNQREGRDRLHCYIEYFAGRGGRGIDYIGADYCIHP